MARLLTRTLESPYFSEAGRMRQLLTYLVDEETAGRGAQLSVYGVAFDVFDRTADFDPQKNSLVRVEMRRLRQLLDAWAHDPRNPDGDRLLVEQGQYRPSVRPRTEVQSPDTSAPTPAPKRRIWARRTTIVLSAILAILVTAITLHATSRAKECRSERPTLTLPDQIQNMSDKQIAATLLGQIGQFVGYYSLVEVADTKRPDCDGAPHFSLKLALTKRSATRGTDELQAVVTEPAANMVVWQKSYPLARGSSDRDLKILASRLVADIIPGGGALPPRALKSTWTNKTALAEYRCAMLAEQYFGTIPAPGDWQAVRRCLIEHYKTSNQADISGYLASVEIEPRYAPELRRLQTTNYYQSAIAKGRSISPRNLQVLMAMMRYYRTRPTVDPVRVNALTILLANDYAYSADAEYQIAYSQSAMLGQYDDALRHNWIATILADDRHQPNLVEVYTNLARGHILNLRPYIPMLELDIYVVSNLIVLDYADAANDAELRARTMERILHSECNTRLCLRQQLTSGEFHQDIYTPLLKTVDRHFPGGRGA